MGRVANKGHVLKPSAVGWGYRGRKIERRKEKGRFRVKESRNEKDKSRGKWRETRSDVKKR